MHYMPSEAYQPICVGQTPAGELLWDRKIKEPWHQKMFPVQYRGDFQELWMRLILHQAGWDLP